MEENKRDELNDIELPAWNDGEAPTNVADEYEKEKEIPNDPVPSHGGKSYQLDPELSKVSSNLGMKGRDFVEDEPIKPLENVPAVVTTKDIQIRPDGSPILRNVGEQLLFADSLVKSGMLPKSYTKAGQVVAAWAMASELGLKPGIRTLTKTAVINGSPAIFGELPFALCLNSGLIEDWEGYHFDKDLKKISFENNNIKEKVYGFYFRVKRKDFEKAFETYYTIDMAKDAKIFRNVWLSHPDDMLKHRTIGKNLKTSFADILNGVPIAEYDFNTMPTDKNPYATTNHGNQESDLNDRFKEPKKTPVVVENEVK